MSDPIAEPFDEGGNPDYRAILLSMWKQLLGSSQISPDDDFFQLGGTSVQAIQVAIKLRYLISKAIPANIVYAARTVSALSSKCLEYAGAPIVEPTNVVSASPSDQRSPLALAPQHLEFVDEMFHQRGGGTDRAIIEFLNVDLERLADAITLVAENQEGLRLTLGTPSEGIYPVQIADATPKLEIVRNVDLAKSSFNNDDRHRLFELYAEPLVPLDGPIVRFTALQAADRTLLLIERSHILFDEHSAWLFLDLLGRAYSSADPGSLRPDDSFSIFLRDANANATASHAFWKNVLADSVPDFLRIEDRTASRQYAFLDSVEVKVPVTQKSLQRRCLSCEVSGFVFLFSLYMVAIRNFSTSSNLLISSTISGRTKIEQMRTIGSMSSNLLFHCVADYSMSLSDLLSATRELVSESYNYLDVSRRTLYELSARDDFVNFTLGIEQPTLGATFPSSVFGQAYFMHRTRVKATPDLTTRIFADGNSFRARCIFSPARAPRDFAFDITNFFAALLHNAVEKDLSGLSLSSLVSRAQSNAHRI